MASTPILISILLISTFLFCVHTLRFANLDRLHASWAKLHSQPIPPRTSSTPPTRAQYPMTPAEAQEIIKLGNSNEMPFFIAKALSFALFKTYGIPSIAKLLNFTTEFVNKPTAGRRYVDTAILVIGFMWFPLCGPGSGATRDEKDQEREPLDPRGAVAVARMNWVHSRYKGKISNDDFLYTLSTFILEPQVWATKYEWRRLSPLEEQAWFVFFSEIGRRMGIDSIPEELSDLKLWAEAYEVEHMVPNEISRDVAAATTKLLLHNVPSFAHSFGRKVVACLLYDRLRESIMVPPPPALLNQLVQFALRSRAFLLRHFSLPRPQYFNVTFMPRDVPAFPPGFVRTPPSGSPSSADPSSETKSSETPTSPPRMHPEYYDNEPWYIPLPTSLPSRAFHSLLSALHLYRPDQLPGEEYKPEGFRFEEIGPRKWEMKGWEEVGEMAQRLQGERLEGPWRVGGGCGVEG